MMETYRSLMAEHLSVFDGQVRFMEGEMFTITLRGDAVPFCVKTPWTVPFAYRDKLKKELELLQQQGIITPVTELLSGVHQLSSQGKEQIELERVSIYWNSTSL